ncbi:AMP-binding protein [Demequina sp. NBRC 110052]|uniref:AMP-binding enzyme n=1 Tax=Demequina sp. NBRC 110052 TaxID=1570341 RepID=UPI0009FC1125|nr:AMP-binding protein [Demequina sp. NBRC 110052]
MKHLRLSEGPEEAIAAVLRGDAPGIAAPTSGSTGAPRLVLVGADAIRASAVATRDRLGGPASWLLAVPADRIAGAMVIARAALDEAPLARMPDGPFTPQGFAETVASMPDGPRRVSLVPTQLGRLLDHPAGADALTTFDAVLVGGAALRRHDVPANVVTTYGMTETSGGCLYDGTPLDGVDVDIDDDGRVLLTGPMLADGYASPTGEPMPDAGAWPVIDGHRWHRTGDLGAWEDGRLTLLGRADDVINSGGVKVHPDGVERALLTLPEVAACVVVGIPDAEWGEAVGAVIEPHPGAEAPTTFEVRTALRGHLPREALPQIVLAVESVPRLPSEKIDRMTARRLLADADRSPGDA